MDQQHARTLRPGRRRGRALRAAVVAGALALAALGSGSSSVSTPLVPVSLTDPAPPADVVATAGDRALAVSWSPSPEPGVLGYRVWVDGAPGPITQTTSATLPGLVNGRSYVITVRSGTQVAGTTYEGTTASSPVSGVPRDAVAPARPTGVTAVRGDGQVRVSWTADTADYDADGYRVLRNGTPVSGLVSGRATTSWTDTGLVNDTTYSYTVQTHDTSGNWSVSSTPAVSATPTDLTAPAAPTGLVATGGDGEVDLVWNANTELDLAVYRVFRDGVQVAEVTGTDHVDLGLTNDTEYSWTLVAVDTHGHPSEPSDPAVATPTDLTPPGVPADVVATAGLGQAVVRWSPVADADLAEYRVQATDGSVLAVVPAPGTQVVLSGLEDDVEYELTVVAVDTAGNVSDPSAAVRVTPVARPVPALGAGESGGLAVSGDGRFVVIGTRARLEPADTNTAYELHLVDRAAGTVRRIAPLPAGATAADSTNASAPAISDDGRYVALATTAALVPADTNRAADVYRLDTASATWALVSVPAGGKVSTIPGTVLHTGPSVYATSPTVVMSADGDLVLFYSTRADLGPRDTNGVVDVFAKRMSTGAVTRVSATATGTDLPRTALGPALALTPDGRFALFPAASSNGVVALYRKTLSGTGAGEALVVSSVPVAGRATEFSVFRDAGDVDLSDDGRYVALVTSAKLGTTTVTASWTTGLAYRVDTATGSVLPLGNGQRTAWEHQVALDPTGRYAFFATVAPQVPGDGNAHTDHFRRDLDGGVAGPLALVTADAAGTATTGVTGSIVPAEYGRLFPVTGDRVLVTTSQALLPADTNRLRDLYAKDLAGGGVRSVVG